MRGDRDERPRVEVGRRRRLDERRPVTGEGTARRSEHGVDRGRVRRRDTCQGGVGAGPRHRGGGDGRRSRNRRHGLGRGDRRGIGDDDRRGRTVGRRVRCGREGRRRDDLDQRCRRRVPSAGRRGCGGRARGCDQDGDADCGEDPQAHGGEFRAPRSVRETVACPSCGSCRCPAVATGCQRRTLTVTPSPIPATTVHEAVVGEGRLGERADRHDGAVVGGGVGDPSLGQHVVGHDQAAGSHEPRRVDELRGVAGLVGVDVAEVIGAVLEQRQRVERGPGVDGDAPGRDLPQPSPGVRGPGGVELEGVEAPLGERGPRRSRPPRCRRRCRSPTPSRPPPRG